MKSRMRFAVGIALVVFASCFPARASLGGDTISVRDDQVKMQGTLKTTPSGSYTIHEIQAANGVVLREYVSSTGNVFGLAWQGRTPPDLRQVLGAYYDQFVQAVQAQRAQAQHHVLGPLFIQQPGLVVEMGGHMRALMGRAFLPQSLPAGVRPEEIR